MKREMQRQPSAAEIMAGRELVTRPVSFEVKYPTLVNGDVGVDVILNIHNGVRGEKGDTDCTNFLFPREDFAARLRKINSLDSIRRIQEIGKISKIRDQNFGQLHMKLTTMFDEASDADKKDRLDKYSEIVNALFHDKEVRTMLRNYVFMETMLTLSEKQEVFQSEEMRCLFV